MRNIVYVTQISQLHFYSFLLMVSFRQILFLMRTYLFTTIVSLFLISCGMEEIPTYKIELTVSPSEGGKLNVSPSLPMYPEGSTVSITPAPNEHWVFKQWEGDGSGSSTPLQLIMDSNKSVVGVFVKREYPLNIIITGEGTVEEKIITNPGGREYPHGTTVELTPKPKEGWVFESWSGDLIGTESPKTIKVDKEKNVTVKFKRKDYSLNISITGEGIVEEKIVTNPGGKSYPFETVVELTPKPKEGWVFESWGGDLTGTEFPKTIKVDKERNVAAKFIRNQTVASLDCSAATNTDMLIPGVELFEYSNINLKIAYSGAFGGTHNGQIVNSTGVTGVTARLEPGTFAIGSGYLNYKVTGMPSAEGTASFAINIGGQTCAINYKVSSTTIIVDVINPKTGKTWMDRNLGSTRAATSSKDVNSYGDLYQWGRRADGHQLKNSPITFIQSSLDQPSNGDFIAAGASNDWRSPSNTNLWQGKNGINNPCPSGYRLPTGPELNEERLSWSNNSREGAFASPLKLTEAGNRSNISGGIFGIDERGSLWSSTVSGATQAQILFFHPNGGVPGGEYAGMMNLPRSFGLSVRCIKD
jgi:hypothetical protein